MKKTNKVHPITFFRKANEARQALVKKSIKKAQDGMQMGPMTQEEAANAAFRSSQNDPEAANAAFRSAQNDPANNPNNEMFRPTPYAPVESTGPMSYKRGGFAKRKK
jgi:hypothetical protein